MKRLVLLLAVGVTVLSVGAAGWLWLLPPNQERALNRIRDLGGKVQVEEGYRDRPVVKVDLRDCPAGDEDLGYLSAFPRLQYLLLTGTRVTEGGLKRLTELKQVRGLALGGDTAGGEGLRHLLAMPSLRELRLETTTLNDAGLIHLGRLVGLESLELSEVAITDDGLRQLTGLLNLQRLSLHHTAVTDAGLVHLTAMRALEELSLASPRITDAGLPHLSHEGVARAEPGGHRDHRRRPGTFAGPGADTRVGSEPHARHRGGPGEAAQGAARRVHLPHPMKSNRGRA